MSVSLQMIKNIIGKKVFIVILFIFSILFAFYIGYTLHQDKTILSADIEPEPSFILFSNIGCEIIDSSSKEDIGRTVSFINLDTDNPRVLLGGRSGSSPMKKIYESEDTLVIQLVAFGTGSVDTFVINKKNGLFSRVSAGSFLSMYAIASKGRCK